MIGAGAVQIFPVNRFANAETLLSLLSTGSTVTARVVQDGAGLALALPQLRVPLPQGTPLTPGTLVDARLVEHNGATQLQLQPRTPVSAQPPPNPAPPAPAPPPFIAVSSLLNETLLSLLPASVSKEQAAATLPRAEGLPRETVRALLEMLVGRERIGAAFARLTAAVEAAVTSGRLPASVREHVATIVQRMLAQDAAEFERAIAWAREMLNSRASAHAAPSSRSPNSLLDELLALREQIAVRGDASSAQTDGVMKALDFVIERLDAGRAQNARGFELPYQFLEIPLSRQTGFDRAQLHVFGDDPRRVRDERETFSVVIDLELSQLGPIWIALHAAARACSCTMRVASDGARHAIHNESSALEASLRTAGYDTASVKTEAWDGDRVAALVAMSSRFSGFEASA